MEEDPRDMTRVLERCIFRSTVYRSFFLSYDSFFFNLVGALDAPAKWHVFVAVALDWIRIFTSVRKIRGSLRFIFFFVSSKMGLGIWSRVRVRTA